MPLIANSSLPTFDRLRREGQEVLDPDRAIHQDIRELHIGVLNMMPDAAMQATERQFLRMIGACNRIAQFYIHLFTFDEIPRGESAAQHIRDYYSDFDSIRHEGLDALIITGANPAQSDLTREPFWEPLLEVIDWASSNVCSVMCSCLATHAIVKALWGIERYCLAEKRWGVYSHRVLDSRHPLTAGINSRFDAPHSHVYEVSAEQFKAAGLKVLAVSEVADLHLAVSPDGLRFVFFQGHPEYDRVSLMKEYKREVGRFLRGHRSDYPPYPEYAFGEKAIETLHSFKETVLNAAGHYDQLPEFPEDEALKWIDNTWSDTGRAIVNSWLGLVYQVAHKDRKKIFMDGIDPDNPLGFQLTD